MTTAMVCAGLLAVGATGSAVAQIIQDTRGASDSFGPGFVALSESRVEFRLSKAGYVILLWVGSDGKVDLYFPLRSRDKNDRKAGRNALSISDVRSPIEAPTFAGAPSSTRPGQMAPGTPGSTMAGRAEEGGTAGYWALIVADVASTAAQVQTRLAPMSREGGVDSILTRLPLLLVEGRASSWAAYYAPVAK